MQNLRFSSFGPALFSVCLLAGCGGSGSNDNNTGQPVLVDRMELKDDALDVGEGTVLSTDLAFDINDVFFFGDHIAVAIKLPRGTSFREGTAEIDGGRADDISVRPRVLQCSDGSSFVEFDLDARALNGAADPSDDADARLKFTVDADQIVGTVRIQGRAERDSVSFSCAEFLPDTGVNLTITN